MNGDRRALKSALAKLASDRRGSTAIALAILTPVIVAGLAFGTEAGSWQLTQRRLQNVADVSAYAAATQLRLGLSESDMQTAALNIVNNSGFTLARSDASDSDKAAAHGVLTLTSPPASGVYAGNNSAIHVRLTTSVERKFTKLFAQNDVTIASEATALLSAGGKACVLALSPNASPGVELSGNTSVGLDGCDVASNSSASNAVAVTSGAADLTVDCVRAVGQVADTHNGITYSECGGPVENSSPVVDPYAGVPEPTWSSCSSAGSTFSGNKHATVHVTNPTGVRCFSGAADLKQQITLDPGVYVFTGNVKSNSGASITGDGVTIFLTNGADLQFNGGAVINLTAPTSGVYSGIVFFGDRDDSSVTYKMNGGSDLSLVGAFYAPAQHVEFSGNTVGSGSNECLQLIANTIKMTGNSEFKSQCDTAGTKDIAVAGNGIRLVE